MSNMKIVFIKDLLDLPKNITCSKVLKSYFVFNQLIKELQKRELPEVVIDIANANIDLVNHALEKGFELRMQIRISQKMIIKTLEAECKIVTKGHYSNYWMALGMAVFGVPIGVVWGSVLNNMGSLGIGIAIGMVIGLAYGNSLDKKAHSEGRQLNVKINSF